MERQAITGTYVLHEHTFSCQGGKWPFSVEARAAEEIPAPKRRDVMDALRRLVQPQKKP
jgi:hypothetical protein